MAFQCFPLSQCFYQLISVPVVVTRVNLDFSVRLPSKARTAVFFFYKVTDRIELFRIRLLFL